MTKDYTPGPWSVHSADAIPDGDDDGRRFLEVMAGDIHKSPYDKVVSGYIACGQTICSVQFGPREANARLIAASPDLVEALDDLQQAEAEYRLMHDRHGDGSRVAGRAWDLMRRAGDKARTALAKAGAA